MWTMFTMMQGLVVFVPFHFHGGVTIRHQFTLKVGRVILLERGQVLDVCPKFGRSFLVFVVKVLLSWGLSLSANEFTHR